MSCPIHPKYKGLRLSKKARQCPGCVAFYEENKANGVKEKRGKEASTVENSGKETITVEKSGAATIYTYKTNSLPKTNEQDFENTSLDIDDEVEATTGAEKKAEEDNVEQKEDEEGCDCDNVDDKTFDDVIEELDLNDDSVVESLFDFDDEGDSDDEDNPFDLEDLNF